MITKEMFESLYSDSILKKEYEQIKKECSYRASNIMMLIHPKIKQNGGWFVFSNYNDHSDGFFDEHEYKEWIRFDGDFKVLPEPYIDSIPTYWLWTSNEDILKEFNSEVAKYKEEVEKEKSRKIEKAKAKKEAKKLLIASISSKLTPQELKIIKFK